MAATPAAAKPPRKRKRGAEHQEPHGDTFSAVVSLGRGRARPAT
eukprot:gene16949-43950_t